MRWKALLHIPNIEVMIVQPTSSRFAYSMRGVTLYAFWCLNGVVSATRALQGSKTKGRGHYIGGLTDLFRKIRDSIAKASAETNAKLVNPHNEKQLGSSMDHSNAKGVNHNSNLLLMNQGLKKDLCDHEYLHREICSSLEGLQQFLWDKHDWFESRTKQIGYVGSYLTYLGNEGIENSIDSDHESIGEPEFTYSDVYVGKHAEEFTGNPISRGSKYVEEKHAHFSNANDDHIDMDDIGFGLIDSRYVFLEALKLIGPIIPKINTREEAHRIISGLALLALSDQAFAHSLGISSCNAAKESFAKPVDNEDCPYLGNLKTSIKDLSEENLSCPGIVMALDWLSSNCVNGPSFGSVIEKLNNLINSAGEERSEASKGELSNGLILAVMAGHGKTLSLLKSALGQED